MRKRERDSLGAAVRSPVAFWRRFVTCPLAVADHARVTTGLQVWQSPPTNRRQNTTQVQAGSKWGAKFYIMTEDVSIFLRQYLGDQLTEKSEEKPLKTIRIRFKRQLEQDSL
jgi:hypothetical protein